MHVSSNKCHFFLLFSLYIFLKKHLSFFFHADFINLLDNYEVSTGVSEMVTSEELKENRLFIDAIMETDVMKVQLLSLTNKPHIHSTQQLVCTPGYPRIC